MRNTYSIEEYKRLTPPVPVRDLSGRIAKAFPAIATDGGSIQNFFLKDDDTGAEVRCGVWDFPQKLQDFQGGFVHFVADDETSIVWKPQRKRNMPTDPKIEIRATAKVAVLLREKEYHGPLSLGAAPQLPLRTPAHLPKVPIPSAETRSMPAPISFPQSGTSDASSASDATEGVRRLACLYQLCAEEVFAIVSTAAAIPGAEANQRAVDLNAACGAVFAQAARDELQKSIDVAAFRRARDPNAPKDGPLQKLRELVGTRHEKATVLLKGLSLIPPTGRFEDLTEEEAAAALASNFHMLLAS